MASIRDRVHRTAERVGIPLAAHFDVVYRCNLRCIHCYLPEKDRYPSLSYREELKEQNRHELETHEIYGILDQLAECGTLFLNLSGGEIFTRSDLVDIVEYARKKRFHISLMTTGTIGLDENVVDRFADLGVHYVEISVYSGVPEVHDSVTRSPGSFRKSIKAVELFRARGIKVRFKCPIMKTNVKTYRSVLTLAESHGASWLFDPNITVGKDGDKRPTYLRISDDELREYYILLTRMSQTGSNGEVEEVPDPLCDDLLSEGPCGAARSSCYISPYGDVQPCIEIGMVCGNLREKSFREIWEKSEEMLMVRTIKQKDLKKCSDCPKPGYCHRCMGRSYVEHGDLLVPSESFCRTVKIRHKVQEEVRQNG